ncbi:hypothetical protein EHP00_680 [Ecytonucleospora hepatopenaei]|uniref:Uncharacterized protein n=1 Tax=Ecytonucleospora hepatopenaei TaxID=646526 RepID=A0A1W0E8M4_9MICR|nr:hypothetical protein EHP00_2567 [Ecytonucleospora hepatopenaei]OQS55581.1 hypothetical protein EHP00_680 [Ecytonucleospora hepatopenaei]
MFVLYFYFLRVFNLFMLIYKNVKLNYILYSLISVTICIIYFIILIELLYNAHINGNGSIIFYNVPIKLYDISYNNILRYICSLLYYTFINIYYIIKNIFVKNKNTDNNLYKSFINDIYTYTNEYNTCINDNYIEEYKINDNDKIDEYDINDSYIYN